jgi:hypothetical protein
MSTSAVYVQDTGHVVGALALTGGGEPVEVAALVGTSLPLRVALGDRVEVVPLDAGRLLVVAADDEPAVFEQPLAFGVETTPETPSTPAKPKPALLRLMPLSDPVTLTPRSVAVEVPLAPAQATRVLVLVSDDDGAHLFTGEIPAGQRRAEFRVDLSTGDVHAVLALVRGWVGWLGAVTVGAP